MLVPHRGFYPYDRFDPFEAQLMLISQRYGKGLMSLDLIGRFDISSRPDTDVAVVLCS